MRTYVYRIGQEKGFFLMFLSSVGATAARAVENRVFLKPKNLKKQKNVSAMSKKT